jgi:hypothetical protein
MRLEDILPVLYAFADHGLQFLKLRAALPADLQMRSYIRRHASRQFSVRVPYQLFVFRVASKPIAHELTFFKRTIARRKNSPTVVALMPSADPISG